MRPFPFRATIGLAAASTLLVVAGHAAPDAPARHDREALPTVTPTGPARSCVSITDLRQSIVRNDHVIDFVNVGRRGYGVVLPQACPDLGFERRFTYETSLSQLCSTDIVTVLYAAPPMRGASCGLGPFQPVTFDRR